MHHRHQLGADRQPQTSTAKSPRGGAICLGKGFEDFPLLFDWNAHPGVAHAEVENYLAGLLALQLGQDPHPALAGELDGVGHQVGDYLAKAGRIAVQRVGDLGGDIGG